MIWTCLMLVGLAWAARPSFAQAKQQGPFADTPIPHWAYDAVNELAALGIFNGYPDQTFGGNRAVTRYELAVAFQRILQDFQRGPLLVDHPAEVAPLTGIHAAQFVHAPVRLTLPEWHARPRPPSLFHRLTASFTATVGPLAWP